MTRFFLCLLALVGVASVVGACPPAVARSRAVTRSVTTVETPAPVVQTQLVPTEVTTQRTVLTPTTVMVPKTVMVPSVVNETKVINVPVTTVTAAGPPVATTHTMTRTGFRLGFWR